jgi:hypothetical protein
MQPIPGWAYVVVGAMISGVSWYVREQGKGVQAMLYFFIIGFVFILVGVYRLVRAYLNAKAGKADLDTLNMQAQINKATAQQPRPSGFSQQQMQGAGSREMPLDPSKSFLARQELLRQTPQGTRGAQGPAAMQRGQQTPVQQSPPAQQPRPMQQPLPAQQSNMQSGGNITASNLFPFRGVKYDPNARPPLGQQPSQQSPGQSGPQSQPAQQRPRI